MTRVLVAAGTLAVVLALRPWPLANALIVAAGGALASRWLAERAGGLFLERIVLASYGMIVALAVGLYAISAARLPVLRGLQLGHGFWTFAWDAPSYDAVARQMLGAWLHGTPFPQREVPEYYVFVALVYLVFGVSPLIAVMLNALLHSVLVVGAFSLACRLWGESAARAASALVAFWPSLLIWSSQLLRDTGVLVLAVILLNLTVDALTGQVARRSGRLARAGWWLVFVVVVLAVHRLRFYVVDVLAGALAIVIVASIVCGKWSTLLRAIVLMLATLGTSVVADRFGDLLATTSRLSAPAPPAPPPASARPTLVQRADNHRQGSVRTGGTLLDPDVRFQSLTDLVIYWPRALANILFAPYPSDWFRPNGTTGPFKGLASLEAVLMYALAAPLVVGSVLAVRSGRPARLVVVTFVLVSATVIGLVIANLGTLFRLRLIAVIPALALAGGGLDWLWTRRPAGVLGAGATPRRTEESSPPGKGTSGVPVPPS